MSKAFHVEDLRFKIVKFIVDFPIASLPSLAANSEVCICGE
jgi:hypothetical protein